MACPFPPILLGVGVRVKRLGWGWGLGIWFGGGVGAAELRFGAGLGVVGVGGEEALRGPLQQTEADDPPLGARGSRQRNEFSNNSIRRNVKVLVFSC